MKNARAKLYILLLTYYRPARTSDFHLSGE